MFARTLWITPLCSIEIGEALGLLHVVNQIHDLQLTNVDFELDANKVVGYFYKDCDNVSEIGVVVFECQRCRNLFFENSNFDFNRRQVDEVTHALLSKDNKAQ